MLSYLLLASSSEITCTQSLRRRHVAGIYTMSCMRVHWSRRQHGTSPTISTTTSPTEMLHLHRKPLPLPSPASNTSSMDSEMET